MKNVANVVKFADEVRSQGIQKYIDIQKVLS